MRRTMMLAVTVALMVPAVAVAQRPEGRRPHEGREMSVHRPAGGVALMLDKASELELTDDQVTRLQQIQTRYDQRTAPLRARADSLRSDRGAARREDLDAAQLRQRRQAAAEIMTMMREEGQAARTEAFALLSGDQQKKVQEMEEARRKEMEARRGRRGGGGEGEGGRRGGRRGPPAA